MLEIRRVSDRAIRK